MVYVDAERERRGLVGDVVGEAAGASGDEGGVLSVMVCVCVRCLYSVSSLSVIICCDVRCVVDVGSDHRNASQ